MNFNRYNSHHGLLDWTENMVGRPANSDIFEGRQLPNCHILIVLSSGVETFQRL